MLKAQLRSKIGALGSDWQSIEDIITGDFFGAIDYLPREPFLASFVEWVDDCNADLDVRQPPREEVDWNQAELLFWPMLAGHGKTAEPDVVIATNRWVLVIEVKLDSGLGADQAWREYCAGRELARNRGLPDDSVFYLVVARERIDISETFPLQYDSDRRDLLQRASFLPWHRVVALVERWLNRDVDLFPVTDEQKRLLSDLLAALRRRRALTFSGFKFINQGQVDTPLVKIFSPDRFSGFVSGTAACPIPEAEGSRFLATFSGFLDSTPQVEAVHDDFLSGQQFNGFSTTAAEVRTPRETFLVGAGFAGFLEGVPRCVSTATREVDT